MDAVEKIAIDVQQVSFSYQTGRKALDNVSLVVYENQIVGLLGPNGGGKTTLFKILSSLIRNYDGRILFRGLDQKYHLRQVLSEIGVVFQSPSLDKKLTVRDNLFYAGKLYGLSNDQIDKRMKELLTSLSVLDRLDDKVEHLSGGLMRRVEMVKSLLHSPRILILDEPSTGLDMGVRHDLWQLLDQIRNEQKITVMLTTHFIEEAEHCDSIFLIHEGKVICSGEPSKLKEKITYKWFKLKPKDSPATKKLLEDRFHIQPIQEHDYLRFQAQPKDVENLVQALTSQVLELNYQDPTLEDVFLFYTGKNLIESAI